MSSRESVIDISRVSLFRILLSICVLTACSMPTPALAGTGNEWLGEVPLKDAVRIGTGKQVVIEVSDPDCRFSRRMVSYWDMRGDITRYVFLVALESHPEAEMKARYILCASDREAAYRKVYAGEFDFGEKELEQRCDDHGVFVLHGKTAKRLGATGTPTYFINGVKVDGAKIGEIERLLGGDRFPFDPGDPD